MALINFFDYTRILLQKALMYRYKQIDLYEYRARRRLLCVGHKQDSFYPRQYPQVCQRSLKAVPKFDYLYVEC